MKDESLHGSNVPARDRARGGNLYARTSRAAVTWLIVLHAIVVVAAVPLKAVATAKKPASTALSVPEPHQVQSRSKPLKQPKTALVPFQTAPFPYHGTLPNSETPFLNAYENGRPGHRTAYGRLYWEDETYSDRRVLLHIPKGFDVRRPSLMIVFFHGHGATLERDVLNRQKVAEQISQSGVNAVLVAPQFAVDASDSSAGNFWQPGAFGRFMGEAAEELAKLHGDPRSVRTFAASPVMFVAYSGGYLPAAWCATKGGLNKRLRGVILLDALYGELGKFASWIEHDRSAFFVSAYLGSTQQKNAELAEILDGKEIAYSTELDRRINKGDIKIMPGGHDVSHRSLVTRAWVDNPIEDLLRRIPGFPR
ncbi:MAG: alpha/beta hydrolase [Hyphomicrobium sp.]|jgi:hypothetical protein